MHGYGTIIGFLTGRILDYESRNRKCKKCDKNIPKSQHDCRKNFVGSAKAMEADVGASLINNSDILTEVGVNARIVIGDDDSTTISAVRKGNPNQTFKLSDINHLKKHFRGDLFELKKSFKEMRQPGTMEYVLYLFQLAQQQNIGKPDPLAATLRN